MQETTENIDLKTQHIQFVCNYLQNNYAREFNYIDATLRLSTDEVFEKLKSSFPFLTITIEEMFNILNDLYVYVDNGDLKIEWLFRSINN